MADTEKFEKCPRCDGEISGDWHKFPVCAVEIILKEKQRADDLQAEVEALKKAQRRTLSVVK